jgi:hypothetical protein
VINEYEPDFSSGKLGMTESFSGFAKEQLHCDATKRLPLSRELAALNPGDKLRKLPERVEIERVAVQHLRIGHVSDTCLRLVGENVKSSRPKKHWRQ